MTIAYEILRISTSTADVAVPQLTQANLKEVSRNDDESKGIVLVTYTIPSGDNIHRTTLNSRIEDPKGAKQQRCTLALNSYAHSTDSVTGAEVWSPISAVLTLNIPKDVQVEGADVAALIGNLYGLTFNTLTSKVPDTAVIDNFRFGQVDHY